MTDPVREKLYPCDMCGKLRTEAEGGTTFTVCDECWEKTMSKSDPVREEMINAIGAYNQRDVAMLIPMRDSVDLLVADLLCVIRGHTELFYPYPLETNDELRVCDDALIKTFESLPEEK